MNQIINWRFNLILIIILLGATQDSVDIQMSMFLYNAPNHKCQINTTENSLIQISNDQCHYELNNITYECKSWIYDQTYLKSTVITELNLVCNKSILHLIIVPLRSLANITTILFSYLSDRFGRKPLLIITGLIDSLLWIVICVVPLKYTSHLILRILKSMVRSFMFIGFVLVSELTPFKYRDRILHNFFGIYGLGVTLASLYMYLMKYWRSAYLLSSLLNIYAILTPFILLESPRWLLINGYYDKAKEVLIKLDQYTNEEEMNKHFLESLSEKKQAIQNSNEYKNCLKSKTLMSRYIILMYGSFVLNGVYFGISTNLSFAHPDIFISSVILGLIELPSGIISASLSYKFGDIRTLTCAGLLSVLFFLISPSNYSTDIRASTSGIISHTVLSLLSKLLFCISWNIYFALFTIVPPTSMRGLSFSIFTSNGVFGASMGTLIGYYFAQKNVVHWSNLIYGISVVIVVIIALIFIPSMQHHKLANTVKEAENIKNHIPCCKDDVSQDAEYTEIL